MISRGMMVVLALVGLVGCRGGGDDDDSDGDDVSAETPPATETPGSDTPDLATPGDETPLISPTPASTPSDTDTPSSTPSDTDTPDSPVPADTPADTPEPTPPTHSETVAAGNVSGRWCGTYTVTGNITVAKGASLELCPGSVLRFSQGVGLRVEGALRLEGTSNLGIQMLASSGRWTGLTVTGTLSGGFVELSGATVGVNGMAGSSVMLEDSIIRDCQYTLQVVNGGVFDRVRLLGGQTVYVAGGLLSMTDSILDLGHPEAAPDCMSVSGGGLDLEHVRFTGCHCPLHFNSSTLESSIVGSIMDGAAVAVMIAETKATFSGNNILGSQYELMDIGGGVEADVAGNYWGGGAPEISGSSGFYGAEDFVVSPFDNAGPR